MGNDERAERDSALAAPRERAVAATPLFLGLSHAPPVELLKKVLP